MVRNRGRTALEYDALLFGSKLRKTLYGETDLFNIGYWGGRHGVAPAIDIGTACEALVRLHLAVDTEYSDRPVGTVLDVGCGLGACTETFAQGYPGAVTYGVNLSVAQLGYARRYYSNAYYAAMDGAHLAVASDSIDRVHSVEAVPHFMTRWAFLAEAFRVLRKGGKLILSDELVKVPLFAIPRENLGTDIEQYLERCRSIGWSIELCDDLTAETIIPYTNELRRLGFVKGARALRTALHAYFLIVLRK